MEVYIEYAFLENFLFDGVLLCLAQTATHSPIRWKMTLFAAFCGGGFALLFPVLILPSVLAYLLKFSVGFLLCFMIVGNLRSKKDWGRYVFTVIWFFLFSFGFGGALLAIVGDGTGERQIPTACVMIGFCLLTLISLFLVRKLYAARAVSRFLYDCRVYANGKWIKELRGFLDSGNLARKNGIPVCFLSVDIFYDLFCEEILKGEGHVRDEITFQTLNGEKKARVYKGMVEVKTSKGIQKKEVYFAASTNIISREYQMIIPSDVLSESMF